MIIRAPLTKYFQGHKNEKSPTGVPKVSCLLIVPQFCKNGWRLLRIGTLALIFFLSPDHLSDNFFFHISREAANKISMKLHKYTHG